MLNKEKTITIALDEYYRLLGSQKQVDELTVKVKANECTDMFKEAYIAQLKEENKQAVKDTAKEILQKGIAKCKELENKYSHLCKSKKECLMETCRYEGVLAVKRELYELAKEKGVEVE